MAVAVFDGGSSSDSNSIGIASNPWPAVVAVAIILLVVL